MKESDPKGVEIKRFTGLVISLKKLKVTEGVGVLPCNREIRMARADHATHDTVSRPFRDGKQREEFLMDEFNPITQEEMEDGGERDVVSPQEEPETEAQGEGEREERNDPAATTPMRGDHQENPSGADNAGQRQAQQSHRFNQAMKAARIQAERETKERMLRERDEEIAALRIPNPNKPGTSFSSLEELRGYSDVLRRGEAERRAKETGRKVEEILAEDEERAFVREQMDKASKTKAAEEAAKKQREFIAGDLADFQKKHPDVDVAKLDGNPQFRRFAGSRYGREPLAELYDDFIAVSGEAAAAAAARKTDRQERGTGAGSGGSGSVLTAEQRAELREWNENYPHMKMSEKEFLEG